MRGGENNLKGGLLSNNHNNAGHYTMLGIIFHLFIIFHL